jgi:hypothetical protein
VPIFCEKFEMFMRLMFSLGTLGIWSELPLLASLFEYMFLVYRWILSAAGGWFFSMERGSLIDDGPNCALFLFVYR